MELVKQHQQDLRTATQFWHGAWRVLTSPTHARSAQSAMSSWVISSTTSQSSFCTLPCGRTCAPSGRPSARRASGSAQSNASSTRSRATILRARYVFPVPGRPVSNRELPAAQCSTSRHRRSAVLVPQPGQRLQALLPALWQPLEQSVLTCFTYRGGAASSRRALATMQCSKPSVDGAIRSIG